MTECPRCRRCWDDGPTSCPEDGGPLAVTFGGPAVIDGKYRLERRLGDGGMGIVYQARHVGIGRIFAVKVIRAWSPGRHAARFAQEARALGTVRHPAIVDVTDSGVDPRDGGLPYLVMECLHGETLDELVRADALSIEEALAMLDTVAAAVDHAHRAGVLHRDLKPRNVWVSRDATGRRTAKVLDFGVARLIDPSEERERGRTAPAAPAATSDIHEQETVARATTTTGRITETGALMGTPAYMAPEVLLGDEATPASDIYSFGALAYEVLTGALPATMKMRALKEPPALPSTIRPALPQALDEPLLAALHDDPARRPSTAAAVTAALRKAWWRAWSTRDRPRRWALAGANAAAAVLIAAWLAERPMVAALEHRSSDARFAMSAPRAPDPRITVLSLDEPSLAADPSHLAAWADPVARRLDEILAAGARGVAIDLLLPASWSGSSAFSDLVLRHRERLALAASATKSGETLGTECLARVTAVQLGQGWFNIFGFANLDEDADGVSRRARFTYPDREGHRRDAFATRAARLLGFRPPSDGPGTFWIDETVDASRFTRVSWKDVEAALHAEPSPFREHLVLLGGEFAASGDNDHRLGPNPQVAVSGVVRHAMIVDTLVSGRRIVDAPRAPILFVAGIAGAALTVALLRRPRRREMAAVGLGLAIAWCAASFVALPYGSRMLPVVPPLLVLGLALGGGLLLRSWRLVPHAPIPDPARDPGRSARAPA